MIYRVEVGLVEGPGESVSDLDLKTYGKFQSSKWPSSLRRSWSHKYVVS